MTKPTPKRIAIRKYEDGYYALGYLYELNPIEIYIEKEIVIEFILHIIDRKQQNEK